MAIASNKIQHNVYSATNSVVDSDTFGHETTTSLHNLKQSIKVSLSAVV